MGTLILNSVSDSIRMRFQRATCTKVGIFTLVFGFGKIFTNLSLSLSLPLSWTSASSSREPGPSLSLSLSRGQARLIRARTRTYLLLEYPLIPTVHASGIVDAPTWVARAHSPKPAARG